ncbi:MDR family MFS transporter [Paenibacillus thalictri]|uniref:DHA2 family efflux MFS transporter permease subunit n=1 Tax=Paenibacillus thalictri TaxID=2527873 RepID=A0A4Q9DZC1_9BACL|nr:MDR family MFS transporter [Paenibacillus thalictri]TBL81835.1 DHA2 family efflux MFS transporter permease subunit [Paenibacillus thalictri]
MDQRKSNVKWTVAGLMLALLLSALDQTIVSTAMPTIVGQLGGLDKFVWVFSAYLIANVISIPIFGKLSDMYGRKLFFLLGLVVFMVGSALCGTSQSMLQLIIYRVVQGIGGGALMPITFAIVFDIFPPEKRGKMQGFFGAVFGLSSVLGPLIGAYFTDYVAWQWIFYINLPLGVVSFIIISIFYHGSGQPKKEKIDWAGTIVFGAAVLSLMLALELGGKEYPWGSWQIIGLFAAFAVLFVLFLVIEKYAASPVIPLALFKNKLFTASMGVGFFYGAVMLSAATYIPLFVQGVFEGSATNAGLVLTPMMLGSVLSSMFGGRFIGKLTYRNIMLFSAGLLIVATALLSTISTGTPRGLVTVYMVLLGLGIGTSFPIVSISALHGIPFHQRGIVSGLVAFFRTIGSAVGVTIFGSIQIKAMENGILSKLGSAAGAQQQISDPRVLLQPQVRAHIPHDVLDKLISAMAESIAYVFQCSVFMAVIGLVFVLLMGKAKMEIPAGAKQKA